MIAILRSRLEFWMPRSPWLLFLLRLALYLAITWLCFALAGAGRPQFRYGGF